MAGRYIIFEGIDGSGKSTLANAVVERLAETRPKVIHHCEPTNLPTGKLIQERLTNSDMKTNAWEWLGLFVADRRAGMEQIVLPALNQGTDVVQDRSMYSTLVYQGAMGIPESEILKRHAGWHPTPDLLVVVDIAARFGLARTRKRSLGRGQRWIKQQGQTYLFKDGDAPQSTEKLKLLQEFRRRYQRIQGSFVLHLPARKKVNDEWVDRSVSELADVVIDALEKHVNPRGHLDSRRYGA